MESRQRKKIMTANKLIQSSKKIPYIIYDEGGIKLIIVKDKNKSKIYLGLIFATYLSKEISNLDFVVDKVDKITYIAKDKLFIDFRLSESSLRVALKYLLKLNRMSVFL